MCDPRRGAVCWLHENGAVTYGLRDSETGQYMGAFSSEDEALTAVRDDLRRYGQAEVELYDFVRYSSSGTDTLARGSALIERATARVHTSA